MGQVVQFRGRAVLSNRKGRIPIAIWVTDHDQPEQTRWNAQFEICAAAGFRALRGFTDVRARKGTRHKFTCSFARLSAFIRAIEPQIDAGRVGVEVAGRRVRARRRGLRA